MTYNLYKICTGDYLITDSDDVVQYVKYASDDVIDKWTISISRITTWDKPELLGTLTEAELILEMI